MGETGGQGQWSVGSPRGSCIATRAYWGFRASASLGMNSSVILGKAHHSMERIPGCTKKTHETDWRALEEGGTVTAGENPRGIFKSKIHEERDMK